MAASTAKSATVDASLWFDSFSLLLSDLENLSLSSSPPPSLVEKVKENQAWFLNTVTHFKPPSQSSNSALNAEHVVVGSHKLSIKPQFKDLALKLSSTLLLDEVQSYILVERSVDHSTPIVDGLLQGMLYEIVLQYYIERQCLLKCVRQMMVHALNLGSAEQGKVVWDEVCKLISAGLEGKLISILNRQLSSSYPQHMDVDLFILWAEDMLIEDNLVLDILFLAYYESLCTCSAATWKELCLLYKHMTAGSSNFVKLGVSAEAFKYCYRAKIQMLLVLIETLDFESLLQMIHDEIPFRNGSCVFSSSDILELDSVISTFDIFETKEGGPLILAWAVFLCLTISLLSKEEHNELMEIDHVGYVRQAFESASMSLFLEILQSDVLKDSDGPVAGYRSILRTFISAFIASYEINQLEDDTFRLILDILSNIYRGEESLCAQFWDKSSIVDGPIRSLLCNLELEFPSQFLGLTRFLSALSEGNWPAECVYNFMEKSVGISSILEIERDLLVGGASQIIETQLPLQVPAVEGLFIPSKTRGRVLKMIDPRTALIRWEYKQSGVLVLLLHLAQILELDGNEEVLVILDLFSRLASFNTAVCFSLMNIGKSLNLQVEYIDGQMESSIWIDTVEVLCNLVRSLSPYSGSVLAMSLGVNILSKMIRSSPSHVSTAVMKINMFDLSLKRSIFDDQNCGLSSGSWLLSGRLAKMLLIDCEHNTGCPLTISVLDFTVQLLEAGVENDFVSALVIFCLQYVFVNHEFWKYKVKRDRWDVTLKVLEVLKTSTVTIPHLKKIGANIRDIIFSDSSVHSMIFRIVCTTSPALEKLYVSKLYDWRDIDGLQQAICSMLEILVRMLSNFTEDDFSGLPTFHQAVISSSTKPIPVVEALASLISYSRYRAIQVRAAEALSMLCLTADYSQSILFGSTKLSLGSKQVMQLRRSIEKIISEQCEKNEELFIVVVKLLTSAANHQPALLAAVFAVEDVTVVNEQTNDPTSQNSVSENACHLVDMLLQYVEGSDSVTNRNPKVLLRIFQFVKALWQGAAQYADIIEAVRRSKNFWKHLSELILLVNHDEAPGNISEANAQKMAYKYRCQSTALDIISLELFLQKKLYGEFCLRLVDTSSNKRTDGAFGTNTQSSTSSHQVEEILLSLCKSSDLSNLLKSCAVCTYQANIHRHAKVAFGLLATHLVERLSTGDAGSLSANLVETVTELSKKLTSLPAFSEICTQYKQRGYSEGIHIKNLVLSDLYYYLQGELEGRDIEHGPFSELSQFLRGSNLLQAYQKSDPDLIGGSKVSNLFDIPRLQHDIGLNLWDYSEWKASKIIAETTLLHMQQANSMRSLIVSRLPTLRALVAIITLNTGNSAESQRGLSNEVYREEILSSIDSVCKELHDAVGLVATASDVPHEVLDFISAQSELLLSLVRFVDDSLPSPSCLVILKTCGFSMKGLRESRLMSAEVEQTIGFLLMLMHLVVKLSSQTLSRCSSTEDGRETSSEVPNLCLGLLPVLCSYTESPDQSIISLATIDLIIKRVLMPSSWFPIIQQHLQLQLLILKLHDKTCFESLPVILKFLLTFARVRGGAEMILASGFLSSLKLLISEISDGSIANWVLQDKSTMPGDEVEKPQFTWGLGLAVLTTIISSLRETSLCADVVDRMISYFFSEKMFLISYHLSAPDFPSDHHDKKRPRAQKRQTSLSAFSETEHTLMLICVLAKHRNSWVKAMKEVGSELRERVIHLLAFISRSQLRGKSSTEPSPFLCLPISKEEIHLSREPSFVNSRTGWFAFAALASKPAANLSNDLLRNAVVIREQANKRAGFGEPSLFTDTVAVKMYRIAFLILKFLCLQAHDAAKRAEELGFIDLSHFPELPDPEILHGLQDQSIAICTEVFEANKSKQIQHDAQAVCLLLLKTLEMSLYLEFCVSQTCGIRPVMGRVEDFSKQIRLLIRATEGHTFSKSSIKQLKQIVSFVYPGLLQSEGIL